MKPGQFIGEMTYLSDNCANEVATASVIADSEKFFFYLIGNQTILIMLFDSVIILEKSYKKLDKSLKSNPYIASKFFHLLCVILANRFIKENSSKLGWKKDMDTAENTPNTVLNINNVNIANNKLKIKKKHKNRTTKKSVSASNAMTINKSPREVVKRSKTINYTKASKFSASNLDLKASKSSSPSTTPIISPIVSPRKESITSSPQRRNSLNQSNTSPKLTKKKSRASVHNEKLSNFKKLFTTTTNLSKDQSKDANRDLNNNNNNLSSTSNLMKNVLDFVIHQFNCTLKVFYFFSLSLTKLINFSEIGSRNCRRIVNFKSIRNFLS